MKRIGYKQGYRIVIDGNFYEVIDGRRVTHFGNCRKNCTIQEIANKTFLLDQEERENADNRNKRIIRKRVSGWNQTRSEANERKTAASM